MWPRFINRVEELRALTSLAERGTYLPVLLYGPEGCGKTRLLRELLKLLDEDVVVVYIDALERERPERALIVRGAGIAADVVAELTSSLPPGGALAVRIRGLVEKIASRLLLRGKRITILVDDVVGAIGLDRVEWYVKYLQSLIEDLRAEYGLESVAVVATTSEGASLERVSRHSYARPRLLWNLWRSAAITLAEELGAPSTVADEVYMVTGGNPRAIIDLALSYEWRIDAWLRDLQLTRVAFAVEELRTRGLEREAAELVENPDAPHDNPNTRILEAYRLLVKHNLMIYKATPLIHGDILPSNRELGIGEHHAWQIPAYREAVKRVLGGQE